MTASFAMFSMPTGNGPGASLDISGAAAGKTIVASGSFRGCAIAVEGSVDGGANWATLCSFQGTQAKYVTAAVMLARVNVSGRSPQIPFGATVGIGAQAGIVSTVVLPMPDGNGPGAAVLADGLGVVKTFIAGGVFPGAAMTIEASDNGTDNWAPIAQFAGRVGAVTVSLDAMYLRVSVSGRGSAPFTATVSAGACDLGGGGGGGDVTAITGSGAAVVTDGGGPIPNVDVPLSKLNVTPIQTATYGASAWEFVRVDPTAGPVDIALPSGATLNVGDQIVVKNSSDSINPMTITPNGGDTIDGISGALSSAAARASFSLILTSATTWEIY